MSGHDPPDAYRFNKLRDSSGSHRLTLVKAAIEAAEIDVEPPRPVFAHLPAGEGVWLGFDLERYGSQRTRVAVRRAVTAELDPDARVVGEFPVPMRGKLGSAVVTLPSRLVEEAGLREAERVTAVAVAPGLLLFLTKERAAAAGDVGSALEGARGTLADRRGR